MKSISMHVAADDYEELKALARRRGRPVAELIRNAMGQYLEHERQRGRSARMIAPHESGRMLKAWNRSELLEEMLQR